MSNDRDTFTGPLFADRVVAYPSSNPAKPLQFSKLLPTAAEIGQGFHPPYQPHSRTSLAAARSLKPSWLAGKRLQVWSALRHATDGLTDEEGIALTSLSPSSYRPRRVELVEAGLVVDSGLTRPSLSGRQMTVWRAKG